MSEVRVTTYLSYTGVDGEAVNTSLETLRLPYLGQNHGAVDVPSGTLDNVAFSIPFGELITTTMATLENKTSSVLVGAFNGQADSFSIPVNGQLTIGGEVEFISLQSVNLTTTDTQVGPGSIVYHLFGYSFLD